jgi:hypothetical protein
LKERIIGERIFTSYVDWEPEPVATTADEALAADGKSSLALAEAEDFLQALLADGEVPSKQVEEEAQEIGITKATLRRAKKELGIKPFKDGMKGGWRWVLPNTLNSTEDARVKSLSTFGTDERLRTQTPHTDMPSGGEMSEDRIDKGTLS